MNAMYKKIGTVFTNSALKEASNDPTLGKTRKSETTLTVSRATQAIGANSPQDVYLTEGFRVQLRTVECTRELFKDEISQSLDSALLLNFGS